ncbi:ABC exporter membrane fusion protein [Nostoc sp. FACHB-892]|uniref:ABC exporter membrane fusion protein n=1 Tax=Nostoc sp. FACHB-892 TaxID=2692843 RepID=UPI00168504E6|nr:ABC exporter membrane fusion protein [Nostoc sp. FACHB-892]MBD2731590.1 ABC exporter membrane fusion protein [Nostoc sp. FACHB-892]
MKAFEKSSKFTWLYVAITVATLVAIITNLGILPNILRSKRHLESSSVPLATDSPVKAVTALGRLEPKGEVIQLTASSQGSRIDQLLVNQGDWVSKKQAIAILDSRPRLQAALEQAMQRVEVTQAQLDQVKAGAKIGEIQAQKAVIGRLEVQLREDTAAKKANVTRLEAEAENAQLEYQRYESLYQDGAVSTSLRDSKRLILQTVAQQLKEAKINFYQATAILTQQVKEAQATLDRIAEVRPIDVRVAQTEVNNAKAIVKQAQAELDLAYVRASRPGQILKIHTWEGEIVDSNKGIVSLGQTNQMYAIAEVYESDLPKVHKGQQATITNVSGGFLTETLQGVVDEVGLEVAKKDVLNTDPAANIDSRVVEVKIRLTPTDSQKVAGFTNMKVKVAIFL